MRHDTGDTCTPDTVRREIADEDTAQIARFLAEYMPAANGPVGRAMTCLYTMTPDNHFILDRHPAIPGLVYACGFCGHGFKFAPVIGEALADLALDGATALPVGFLSAGRFGTRRCEPAA
jgi:sarcosine oxidase